VSTAPVACRLLPAPYSSSCCLLFVVGKSGYRFLLLCAFAAVCLALHKQHNTWGSNKKLKKKKK